MSAPERIFLQWGYELPGAPDPYPDDVTWCADRVDENDVEYVRADIHAATERAGPEAEDEAGRHRATIERLTALLKESDDERVALKEHYPKLRSQLAAARAKPDGLTVEDLRRAADGLQWATNHGYSHLPLKALDNTLARLAKTLDALGNGGTE